MKKLILILSLSVILFASNTLAMAQIHVQVNPFPPVYVNPYSQQVPPPGYYNPYPGYNPYPAPYSYSPGVYINPGPGFYRNPYRHYYNNFGRSYYGGHRFYGYYGGRRDWDDHRHDWDDHRYARHHHW